MATGLELDRAYARAMLPRVSRTFALNIRLLRGSLRDAVEVAYLLCRSADALEDSWAGSPSAVASRFDTLQSALSGTPGAALQLAADATAHAGEAPDLELLAGLPRQLRVLGALDASDREPILACLGVMTAGMRRYAVRAAARGPAVAYLDTGDELDDYCYVVAGCVGEMLTRLVARRLARDPAARAARRLSLAPTVGAALQLTNVLLDWPVDVRRGRCHVPAAWLAEHDLSPADLVAQGPGVRTLAERLATLAREALAGVPVYLATLPAGAWRFRMFTLVAARWARASLELAMGDPTFPAAPQRPKLTRAAIRREALAALFEPAGRALAAPHLATAADSRR